MTELWKGGGLRRRLSEACRLSVYFRSRNAVSRTFQAEELFAVADTFDPYREALVMETNTVWPEEYDDLSPKEKARIESALHADPKQCAQLEYIREHTGVCRQITVRA